MKDYLKQFNTTAEYNTYINGTPDLPNVSLTLDDNEVHYNKYVDYSKEYLTFEALESGTFTLTVPVDVNSTKMTSVSYSIDDGANWTTTTIDNTLQTITTPTINAGDKVLWKGIGDATAASNQSQYASTFSSSGRFNAEGNIMSLFYGDNFRGQTSFNSVGDNFSFLFYNSKVVSAENLILPATTLRRRSYCSMFYKCTSLTTAPTLSATTLADYCYQNMFSDCTSLTTAPSILPATTLANNCYNGMFVRCTLLTTAPVLPATTLADSCYGYMFMGCSNLNSITMFATDISPYHCLDNWVKNVAATGTFTKAASATIPTGTNGIPSGWTVVDA